MRKKSATIAIAPRTTSMGSATLDQNDDAGSRSRITYGSRFVSSRWRSAGLSRTAKLCVTDHGRVTEFPRSSQFPEAFTRIGVPIPLLESRKSCCTIEAENVPSSATSSAAGADGIAAINLWNPLSEATAKGFAAHWRESSACIWTASVLSRWLHCAAHNRGNPRTSE